jgi:hypothetical protein
MAEQVQAGGTHISKHLPLLVMFRVSLRLAWARKCVSLDSRATLPYSTPRSITPSPDSSFLQTPRPIAVPRHQSMNPPFPPHVLPTWQCAAAIQLQTLEASHSHTCCTYTTHAPARHNWILSHAYPCMHACIHPHTPHASSHRTKKTNIIIPASPRLCFPPCPNEWPPRGTYTYTHARTHACRTKHAHLHVH